MNIQQLLIIGRATKQAEILESKEGKKFGKFSIAVNEFRKDKAESEPTFYNVLVFNKTFENITRIEKGNLVMVDGRPSVDAYLNQDGEAKANLVVFANRWKVIK